jgi:hypothetical protein
LLFDDLHYMWKILIRRILWFYPAFRTWRAVFLFSSLISRKKSSETICWLLFHKVFVCSSTHGANLCKLFNFQVHAVRRPWFVRYCINIIHRNCKCMSHFSGLFHVCIKTLWWLFWCFILGHEALCVFKFVTKFSKICLCFFWVDIIISRNIYVRMISFTVFPVCSNITAKWYVNTFCLLQIYIHGLWHCYGTT